MQSSKRYPELQALYSPEKNTKRTPKVSKEPSELSTITPLSSPSSFTMEDELKYLRERVRELEKILQQFMATYPQNLINERSVIPEIINLREVDKFFSFDSSYEGSEDLGEPSFIRLSSSMESEGKY